MCRASKQPGGTIPGVPAVELLNVSLVTRVDGAVIHKKASLNHLTSIIPYCSYSK